MKRRKRDTTNLIERVLHSGNLTMACKEVVRNKGAGGVDGMKVSELKEYLDQQRSTLEDEFGFVEMFCFEGLYDTRLQ